MLNEVTFLFLSLYLRTRIRLSDCPIAAIRFRDSETRRDETRRRAPRRDARDALMDVSRMREDARREFEEAARRREDLYDALIEEREYCVAIDAWDADTVLSFLKDLRRDDVDWDRTCGRHELDCEAEDDEHFYRYFAGPCVRATRMQDQGCLQFLHEHEAPWDEWTCAFAAKNGNLDCLKYAREQGCDWDEETCVFAAENGYLECLKYAHENGCPWNEWACALAAWNGQLECLKYAHEQGCRWNESTCANAASNGQLECLKYAHEEGCPWDKDECIGAARANVHTACVTYMLTLKDALESRLDDAMSALDEIARDIPEGAYVKICAALKLSHDEHKKRKR